MIKTNKSRRLLDSTRLSIVSSLKQKFLSNYRSSHLSQRFWTDSMLLSSLMAKLGQERLILWRVTSMMMLESMRELVSQ